MLLDQREGCLGVELVRRHQHRLAAASDHVELVHAGAVRQRRQHERAIVLGRTGHQVAQMVGDDEAHLPVGQHRGFRPPGRARGEEQPAGAVPLHRGVRHGCARPGHRSTRRHSARSPWPRASPVSQTTLDSRNGAAHRSRHTQESRSGTGRRAAWSPPPCRPRRQASTGNWSAPRPHRCGRSRASTPASRCCSCCARARPRLAGRPDPAARRPAPTRARRARATSRIVRARPARCAPGSAAHSA